MIIGKTSFIGKYYKWMYNELPSDFCTLFWKSLISLLFLPLAFPLYFFPDQKANWNNSPIFWKAVGGMLIWLILFLIFLFGFAVLESYYTTEVLLTWSDFKLITLSFLIGILVSGIVIGGIIGIIFLIMGIRELYFFLKYRVTQREVNVDKYGYVITEPSQVVVMWSTIRNKYCTKITWK
jgi:hypothetical protein